MTEPIIEPDLRWEPTDSTLKFQLGEWILTRRPIRALSCRTHFMSIPVAYPLVPPEEALLGSGREVAVVTSCPVDSDLPSLKLYPRHIRYVSSRYRHYLVETKGTFDDYLAGFKSKTRSGLKRKVNKFHREFPGEGVFREYRQPEEMAEFLNEARKISARTFQERLLGRGLPEGERFLDELKEQAGRDQLRGYILFAGDDPVSFILAPVIDEQIALYDYVGFDPAFGHLSPGTVLQYHVVESLFAEENLTAYDLCTGEGEHKRLFATRQIDCADIYFFRKTFRFLVMTASHLALSRISSSLVKLLSVLGLKRRLKKFFRAKA
jgi:CelD/BcsL family acetyltransferase involved in cellulose biosynthesis